MTEQKVTFALFGPCVAWHRAKLSKSNRIDGRGRRHYKDNKDREFQLALGMSATSEIMKWAYDNGTPWDASGEFHLDMEFHVQDKIKRDIDNLEKNVLDSLSTIVFDDDNQVVSVKKKKVLNRKSPRTIVTVSRVDGFLE